MPSDTDYLSAVQQGDTQAAQRMVDEAAKAAGYTVGPVWHGTRGNLFTVFDKSRIGTQTAMPYDAPKGFYFSKDQKLAERYGPNKIRAFVKGPFLLDNSKIAVVESSGQIKSAEPITRDDAGNVIPLSQRFKAASEDIRFMPSPDSAMPGAYSFQGGYRAIPGKTKGSFRLYGPAGSLIGIASSLDEAQRILRRKTK